MLRLDSIKFTRVRIELPWEKIGRRQGKRRALRNSIMHQKFRRDLASSRYVKGATAYGQLPSWR
eukprot:9941082-Karenia_brevis.AAC.1